MTQLGFCEGAVGISKGPKGINLANSEIAIGGRVLHAFSMSKPIRSERLTSVFWPHTEHLVFPLGVMNSHSIQSIASRRGMKEEPFTFTVICMLHLPALYDCTYHAEIASD